MAAGDSLGVQAKGKDRRQLKEQPVQHYQAGRKSPFDTGVYTAGSALSFCLAQSITENATIDSILENFLLWKNDNYWTALGKKIYADEEVENANFETPFVVSGTAPAEKAADVVKASATIMRIAPLVFSFTTSP